MRKTALLSAGFAAIVLSLPLALPAQAASRTFVSGLGSGSVCSRAAPCASLQAAFDATDDGGEINCVDPISSFGLIINKSITIDCTGTSGGTTATSLFDLTVQVPNGFVTLRGLSLNGFGSNLTGVVFDKGTLRVENCRIAGFRASGGSGIRMLPGSGIAKLHVVDSVIEQNGGAGSGGGIIIQPDGSGSAQVLIERTRIENNVLGILVDGSFSTARSVVKVNGSVIAGSTMNGITVIQAGALINRTAVEGNAGNGVLAGPGAVIHLGASTVATNSSGGLAYNGGQILSYQNNRIKGNGVDNDPSGVLALK